MGAVEVAVEADALIGECPLWDPLERLLYWIDIEGRTLHRFDPENGSSETVGLEGRPGSIALTGSPGRLVIAMETDLVWFEWSAGSTTPWLQVEESGRELRLNDGRTDPFGRFWVGSMDERFEDGDTRGQLHRIDPDGTVTSHKSDLAIPNGLAFDPDRARMYFADTVCGMVWKYDYDQATGTASDETPFIDFSDLPGNPDGACVDVDGGYWIAAAFGWAVMRFTPEGKLDQSIELPVQTPTMPAFGGSDLSTLYVTTMGSRFATAPDQHHAGSVFAIDTGVTGCTDSPFLVGEPPGGPKP